MECRSCAAEWEALVELRTLGRELPYAAPSQARIQAVRERVLRAAQPREQPLLRRRMGGLLAVAAGLALIAGVRLWRAPQKDQPLPPSFRAAVFPLGAASFEQKRSGEEEWVRLSEGEVRVAVQPLRSGERFRVISSDGEVEVRGTVFETKVVHDHLMSVAVLQGHVEVRRYGGQPEGHDEQRMVRLGPGERWQAEVFSAAPPPSPPPPPKDAAVAASLPPSRQDSSTKREAAAWQAPARTHMAAAAAARPPAAATHAERAFATGWESLRRGRFADAAGAFDEAVAAGAGEPILEDARFWRAVALARAERRAAAIPALRDFLLRHPASPRFAEASSILGWQLFKEGLLKEAEPHFRTAVKSGQPAVRESAHAGLLAISAQRAAQAPKAPSP